MEAKTDLVALSL